MLKKLVTVFCLTTLLTFVFVGTSTHTFAYSQHGGKQFIHVCGAAPVGYAHCHALRVSPNASSPAGYNPADLQSAYNLPSSTAGSGQTVAIVDAYDDPNAESDLGIYRSQFGLPACTTANGCFKKVDQNGGTNYPRTNRGWAQEISLDLDMASAICPNCHILLVEASSNSLTNLGTAVNRAAALGANEISNSYGGGESSSDSSYDSTYYNHPGIAITVSSGDSGYGVQYPAASQYVTAVGGTTLNRASNTRGWSETTWSGAGSGCSAYDPKPSWQKDSGCSKRTVADVSAVADPNTGVSVYDSFTYQGQSGWLVFGGTSVASPIIASIYALAGNASTATYGSYPYSHSSSLNDVTSGSNGSCGGSYLCTAGTGYDGPTGLGTPNGTGGF
jgi:subtilase family serine protease